MQAQEPTAEEMERARKHEQAEHERVNKRLNAVREAYWQTSAEGDFYSLHDALVSTVMKGSRISPTQHHIKALFMMLPASIIGQGVAWGFGDTEVGDDIYSFVEKNQSAVIKQLGLPTA